MGPTTTGRGLPATGGSGVALLFGLAMLAIGMMGLRARERHAPERSGGARRGPTN